MTALGGRVGLILSLLAGAEQSSDLMICLAVPFSDVSALFHGKRDGLSPCPRLGPFLALRIMPVRMRTREGPARRALTPYWRSWVQVVMHCIVDVCLWPAPRDSPQPPDLAPLPGPVLSAAA